MAPLAPLPLLPPPPDLACVSHVAPRVASTAPLVSPVAGARRSLFAEVAGNSAVSGSAGGAAGAAAAAEEEEDREWMVQRHPSSEVRDHRSMGEGEVSVRWEDQEDQENWSANGGAHGPVLGPQEEETGKPGSAAPPSPETGVCTAQRSHSPATAWAGGRSAEASATASPLGSTIAPRKLGGARPRGGGARGRTGAAWAAFALAALLGLLALATPLVALGTARPAQAVTPKQPRRPSVEQPAVAPARGRPRRERLVVWLILAARGDTEVAGRGTCWPGLVPGCLSG